MKALTVRQPWAWAIVHGGKDVENRVQAWSYRGPLAIHAAATWSDDGAASPVVRRAVWDFYGTEAPLDQPLFRSPESPRTFGAIIGVVDLINVHVSARTATGTCCSSAWAQYAEGPTKPVVHLRVENPRPLPRPVIARGQLGLWTPNADTLAAIREQVPA